MKVLILFLALSVSYSHADDDIDLIINQAIKKAAKETDKELGVAEYKESISKILNELEGEKK